MSYSTQNNNINSEARDCCGYDECERPMCDECEECCIGSAVCTRCETDYCTECEVGGDDNTPEQEWVCDACLEEIADCEKCDDGKPCYICCCDKAESTDEDTDDDQSDDDDEDKTCHTCKKEYEVEAGRGGYEGHECFECFEKKTTKKKHKKKPPFTGRIIYN
tara:strand:- start:6054 stop:6542 length:489 start_codon:yes stop_codon:yes gene_type:complete